MSFSERQQEEMYPIPSDNKAEGWQRFLNHRDLLLERAYPSDREVKILHRLTTSGVKLPPFSDFMRAMAAVSILCDDMTDEIHDEIATAVMEIGDGKEVIARAERGELYGETKVRVEQLRRGHLRQYGKKQTQDGTWHTVYAPHNKPFFTEEGEIAYLGLTSELGSVFAELCAAYDSLREEVKDRPIGIKLEVMAFFQLWGASVIHPFYDGNGRAFSSKLVLDLNRAGIKTDKMPELGEINPDLADNALAVAGEHFLQMVLQLNNIPMFTTEELPHVMNRPEYLRQYMTYLREAIRSGIANGVSQQSPYYPLIDSSREALMLSLSKDGHINPDYYAAKAPGLIAARKEWERSQQR